MSAFTDLLPLQSLLQLQPERLGGVHHARSHHVDARVVHVIHAGEAASLAHLIDHGIEAGWGLAWHAVATVTLLHGYRRRPRGARRPWVALAVDGLLVHA